MENPIDRLFREFDSGRVSRRELLRALGVAALAIPASAFAQDTTSGRGRGREPRRVRVRRQLADRRGQPRERRRVRIVRGDAGCRARVHQANPFSGDMPICLICAA